MNSREISGERLFLLYAFPCTEIRLQCGLMKPEDAKVLKALVDEGQEPSHGLLGKCFQDAIRRFALFAGLDPLADGPWPIETVRCFWREHKGRTSSCAVMCGEVEIVNGHIEVRCVKGARIALNRYKLPVVQGDIVHLHQHVIVEVDKGDERSV